MMVKNFLRSFMGGMMIAIGATAYLSCDNKYVGAFLFTLGLFAICVFSFGLYTGKVGYIFIKKQKFYVVEVLVTLLGNAAATIVFGTLMAHTGFAAAEKAKAMCEIKTAMPLFSAAVRAFFCGVLMFIAVNSYNEKDDVGKYIGMFIAVPVFVISGFEHSVANLFYFSIAKMLDIYALAFAAVCAVGNAVGALVTAAAWKLK